MSISISKIILYSQDCDEGYLYFTNLSENVNNLNNDKNCFLIDDLTVIENLISLNALSYSNVLEVGDQSWNTGRLFSWVLTYTPNGNNGIYKQLTALPEDIGDLTSLSHLYLDWNQITILPGSFSNLTNLTNLVISNNLLTSLPADFGNLINLSFLDLSYNQLESIPESIKNLENITYLWIFNNKLNSVSATICTLQLLWDGTDSNNYPYFIIGGNQLCDSELIPDCVANSDYFDISINQSYYTFLSFAPQNCENTNEGLFLFYHDTKPNEYSIHKTYPNPFNPVTNITYGLPEHVHVKIIVYDLSGKHVETLINGFQKPGYHLVNWYANNLPSGVYLIRMDSGDFTHTRKVVLVK